MVTQDNEISASDINAIIALINGEENGRGVGLSDLATVSAGDSVASQKFKDMINRNTSINNFHCYCEADGARAANDTTKTGTTLSLTAALGDHDVGDEYNATNINEIDTDIDSLIAQCDCNTYACTCESDCTQCTCNTFLCTCVGNCVSECTCNTYSCPCQGICTCDHWFDMCSDGWWICLTDNPPCSCAGYTCLCQGVCATVCTCNQLCSCITNCVLECGCDLVCSCEYN